MFGSIGIGEIVLIAGIALMVLGPDKFPEFAKMAARLVRDLRKYTDEVKRDLTDELKPMKKELEDLSRVNPEEYLDSLMGEDEEDDGTINPEPEFDPNQLYGADEIVAGEDHDNTDSADVVDHAEESPSEQQAAAMPYQPYDEFPQEEDGFEMEQTDSSSEESPERLDG